jgi:hypothetical protein
MSSSRRSSNPPYPDSAVEPFPSYPPTPGAGPRYDQDVHTSTTTTTTTTTTLGGRSQRQPVTTTTYHAPQVAGPSHASAPVSPATFTTNNPNAAPYSRTELTTAVPHTIRRRPISIRRLPTASRLSGGSDVDPPSRSGSQRGRSTSAPQQPHLGLGSGGSQRLTRQSTRPNQPELPTLREEASQSQQMGGQPQDHLMVPGQDADAEQGVHTSGSRRRTLSNAARSIASRLSSEDRYAPSHEYETEVVDLLDVIGGHSLYICLHTTDRAQILKFRP